MSELYSRIIKRKKATPELIEHMFNIFEKYYDGVDKDVFKQDLDRKTHIILLKKKADHQVVGFSTQAVFNFGSKRGRQRIGIFSGDTVIEQAYWGNKAIQWSFSMLCLRLILRHPFSEVYWMLISKGYKTYMLLANNFVDYYPHPTRNQSLKELVDEYTQSLFPDAYDAERGVLDFGGDYQKLKSGVAEITDDMLENPRIRLFVERNPGWSQGHELPCIAKIDFKLALFFFGFKRFTHIKNLRNRQRNNKHSLKTNGIQPIEKASTRK